MPCLELTVRFFGKTQCFLHSDPFSQTLPNFQPSTMATDTYYPNNGIYPPQTYADLVYVAMRYSKTHAESVAETKRLLGADAEPRHPSNNAAEILQCIMSKLGPGGLFELLRVPTGQRHPYRFTSTSTSQPLTLPRPLGLVFLRLRLMTSQVTDVR